MMDLELQSHFVVLNHCLEKRILNSLSFAIFYFEFWVWRKELLFRRRSERFESLAHHCDALAIVGALLASWLYLFVWHLRTYLLKVNFELQIRMPLDYLSLWRHWKVGPKGGCRGWDKTLSMSGASRSYLGRVGSCRFGEIYIIDEVSSHKNSRHFQ